MADETNSSIDQLIADIQKRVDELNHDENFIAQYLRQQEDIRRMEERGRVIGKSELIRVALECVGHSLSEIASFYKTDESTIKDLLNIDDEEYERDFVGSFEEAMKSDMLISTYIHKQQNRLQFEDRGRARGHTEVMKELVDIGHSVEEIADFFELDATKISKCLANA